ncbi:hypothetical protein [Pontibacter ummariensis]|nr:hypothetical protein [Pontibacter ummariensis]
MKHIQQGLMVFCILIALGMSSCRTSNEAGTVETASETYKSMAPQRVDVRGSIIRSQYNQGQVILEVEGLPSPDSRFNRAFVLVEPITQIVDAEGRTISLSELRQGQNVAILLRGGGQGNFVGLGVARKLWVEEPF